MIVAGFYLQEFFSFLGPAFSPQASGPSIDAKGFGNVFIARSRRCSYDDITSKHLALGTEAAALDFLDYGQLFVGKMNRNRLGSSGLSHVHISPLIEVSGRLRQPGNEVSITRDSSGLCSSNTRQLSRFDA